MFCTITICSKFNSCWRMNLLHSSSCVPSQHLVLRVLDLPISRSHNIVMSPDTDSVFWKYILFFHQLPFTQVFKRKVGRGHRTKRKDTQKRERSLREFSCVLVFCVVLNSKIIFTNPYLQVFYWPLNLVTCKLLGMNIKITAQWSLTYLQKRCLTDLFYSLNEFIR